MPGPKTPMSELAKLVVQISRILAKSSLTTQQKVQVLQLVLSEVE